MGKEASGGSMVEALRSALREAGYEGVVPSVDELRQRRDEPACRASECLLKQAGGHSYAATCLGWPRRASVSPTSALRP